MKQSNGRKRKPVKRHEHLYDAPAYGKRCVVCNLRFDGRGQHCVAHAPHWTEGKAQS